MELHNLVRKTKNKKKKVVGRGGARGKTSGRGTKGQNARAGRKKRPELRDIIKKLPKLRGYKFSSSEPKSVIVNLADLNIFEQGAKVNPSLLVDKKLVKKVKGITPKIKILNNGDITRAIMVSGCMVSKEAKIKIEKAGGSVA